MILGHDPRMYKKFHFLKTKRNHKKNKIKIVFSIFLFNNDQSQPLNNILKTIKAFCPKKNKKKLEIF